jgi:hypothetical protein
MKIRQIILGAASTIAIVGSGLAFKVSHKFSKHPVYGRTSVNSTICKVCRTWFTSGPSLVEAQRCKTSNGVNALFTAHTVRRAYLFTNLTFGGVHCGNHIITKVGTDD